MCSTRKNNSENTAYFSLTPFLTATGFIAAILLVWAQTWDDMYAVPLPDTVYIGLIWTYLAVLIDIIAFALAGYSYLKDENKKSFQVSGLPVSLLISAIIMTVINIYQTIISVFIKFVREDLSIAEPLIYLETGGAKLYGSVIVVIAVAIIIFLSWFAVKNYKKRSKCVLYKSIIYSCIIAVGLPLLLCLIAGKHF